MTAIQVQVRPDAFRINIDMAVAIDLDCYFDPEPDSDLDAQ